MPFGDWRALEYRCQRCLAVGAQASTFGQVRGEAQSLGDVTLRGETSNMGWIDRKSTRLNSSHGYISYAVFCLKKKKTHTSEGEWRQEIEPSYADRDDYSIN